jgi:DNA-binding GntR family transcriptional regulator
VSEPADDDVQLALPALPRNAGHVAAEVIRQAIFDGRLGSGRRLKEADLASQFGLSRTPIREALLVLQAEGLVRAEPNRGASVRAYSLDEMADLYDLRAHLESYAARRAATRATDDEIAELFASCDRYDELREAGDTTGLGREDLTFHFGIAQASRSAKLLDFVRSAIEQPLVYRSFRAFTPAEWALSTQQHRRVATTIAARDAQGAELAMREHIFRGLDFWLGEHPELRVGSQAIRSGS